MKTHHYKTKITWTGNEGKGTKNYTSYSRSHSISVDGKYDKILSSSDPSFRGDKTKYNPEELLLASISSCHMLWYLHLCSSNKITVVDYIDNTTGKMVEDEDGSRKFTEVTLNPVVTISERELIGKAEELHHQANQKCFIANSVNFKVGHNSIIKFYD